MPPPDETTRADETASLNPAAEERTASSFLEKFTEDCLNGVSRTLEEYQSQFPRFPERIAREWHALVSAANPEAPGEVLQHVSQAMAVERTVGPYRLLSELGRGGQGVVYLAEDTRIARRVALKVLTETWNSLPSVTRARLLRETSALSKLDHPGICTLFDAAVLQDSNGRSTAYIAMRYLDGESLARTIARRRQTLAKSGVSASVPDYRAIAEKMESVARAIHAAHECGILHRDLKPGNIMCTTQQQWVVLDFGLAREEESELETLTRTGEWVGTPAYMSPEQLDSRRGAMDARADVWALGVTLYETLSLKRPFDGPTRDAIVREVLDGDCESLRRLCPGIPDDLATIVETALERDLARRYQSALALAEDLRRWRAHEPISARKATLGLRLRRFVQRERALATSLGALLTVLVGGVVITTVLYMQADQALTDVIRLSDARTLREMLQEELQLYPSVAERVTGPDGMDAWLARARELYSHLPDHRASLARIQSQLKSIGNGNRDSMRESGRSLAWWREQLEQLVKDLEKFPETVERVEKRRAFALDIRRRSIDEPATLWSRASAEVAADARFAGFTLKPQIGLVPLGADPQTKLQEFVHLESGAAPQRDRETGRLQITRDTGLVLVLLPGGRVRTGIDPVTETRPAGTPHADPGYRQWEGPSQELDLAPFFISKFEITVGQWLRTSEFAVLKKLMGSASASAEEPRVLPATQINWFECDTLFTQLGLVIPTEAQWEYAARAGATTPFWSGMEGQTLNGKENFADRFAKENGGGDNWDFDVNLYDGWLGPSPVGTFAPNGFGLYDVSGNVAEWVRDTWEDFTEHPARAGDGFRAGSYQLHLVRGSDFANDTPKARLGSRRGVPPETQNPTIGARPARRVE